MHAKTLNFALSIHLQPAFFAHPHPALSLEGEGVFSGFLKIRSQSVVLSLTKDKSLNRVSPL